MCLSTGAWFARTCCSWFSTGHSWESSICELPWSFYLSLVNLFCLLKSDIRIIRTWNRPSNSWTDALAREGRVTDLMFTIAYCCNGHVWAIQAGAQYPTNMNVFFFFLIFDDFTWNYFYVYWISTMHPPGMNVAYRHGCMSPATAKQHRESAWEINSPTNSKKKKTKQKNTDKAIAVALTGTKAQPHLTHVFILFPHTYRSLNGLVDMNWALNGRLA